MRNSQNKVNSMNVGAESMTELYFITAYRHFVNIFFCAQNTPKRIFQHKTQNQLWNEHDIFILNTGVLGPQLVVSKNLVFPLHSILCIQ